MNKGKMTCCTNGYENTSNDLGNELFNTAFECCEDGLGMGNSGNCPFEDVCFPNPPTPTPPAVNTPMPTFGSTPNPTQVEVLETPEPTTYMPSPVPTFGSTPTVSKETTGPPTMAADRGGRD